MKVSDVMTRDVTSVTPDTPLRDVARLLGDKRISGVPVVANDGTCIGIVSEADLLAKQVSRPSSRRSPLEWILGEQRDPEELRRRGASTAEEAMSSPVISVAPDRPLRDAAALMVDLAVNRLPVISGDELVGIVTRADLVRAYLRLDEDIEHTIRDDVLRRTMWLDPDDFAIEVREGHVRIGGHVDRRSTARIIERLVGLVDGVAEVESHLVGELDDSRLPSAVETDHEPGAASITARETPPSLHR
jgi:CBS domain-containing protein